MVVKSHTLLQRILMIFLREKYSSRRSYYFRALNF